MEKGSLAMRDFINNLRQFGIGMAFFLAVPVFFLWVWFIIFTLQDMRLHGFI